MMLGLIIAACVVGHLVLWVAASRAVYRKWPWDRKTTEGEKRLGSGFWGFLWPLTLTGFVFGGLFAFIGWATVHPSLKETREKRRQERQQRLADLPRQIEAAEAELQRVTGEGDRRWPGN